MIFYAGIYIQMELLLNMFAAAGGLL